LTVLEPGFEGFSFLSPMALTSEGTDEQNARPACNLIPEPVSRATKFLFETKLVIAHARR
jgi:hypothetical protein